MYVDVGLDWFTPWNHSVSLQLVFEKDLWKNDSKIIKEIRIMIASAMNVFRFREYAAWFSSVCIDDLVLRLFSIFIPLSSFSFESSFEFKASFFMIYDKNIYVF